MLDLENGLSLAQVILAILSLGAGGYLGGQAAAVQRMRLIDRRTIYSDHLSQIRTVPVAQEDRLTEHAMRFAEHWGEIQDLVQLLSWMDRLTWVQVQEAGPLDALAALQRFEEEQTELERDAHGNLSRQRRAEAASEIDTKRTHAISVWRREAAQWEQRHPTVYEARLVDFRNYLEWSLAPSVVNRVRRRWLQVKLARRITVGHFLKIRRWARARQRAGSTKSESLY